MTDDIDSRIAIYIDFTLAYAIFFAAAYGKFQRHRPPFDDVRRVGQTHLQDVPDKVGYHGKLGFGQGYARHRHRH